jgi:hypothetical protein
MLEELMGETLPGFGILITPSYLESELFAQVSDAWMLPID